MQRDHFRIALANCLIAAIASATAAAAERPIIDGTGTERKMLVEVTVVGPEGQPAEDHDLLAKVKREDGKEVLEATRQDGHSKVWIPIGGSRWFYVELSARSNDGEQRAFRGITMRELREAALDGVELQLTNADRLIKVSVHKDGQPVSNAHVAAELPGNELLQGETDAEGHVTFRLLQDEKLQQLTAWTDEPSIGGYSFNRKPHRDPLGVEHTIELENCRDQTIRFVLASDGSPVSDVAFDLTIGTGAPNYNFPAVPHTFPHCRLVTDEQGEATFRWFPDWEKHGSYVEIVGSRWAKASEDGLETAEDGALVMKLKPRVERRPLMGKVTSDGFDVTGLMVQIRSFQGEEEGYSDHLNAFTNAEGNFSTPCIPGATYSVCVDDTQLVSSSIDLVPYEPDTGRSNAAELSVTKGEPVEIRITSGPKQLPMPNVWINLRAPHDYTWYEEGEERSGSSGRSWGVYTDQEGVARTSALAGSQLEVSVYTSQWRPEEQEVTVKSNEVTTLEFHRPDIEHLVQGQLIATPNAEIDLPQVDVMYASIDGETDEGDTIHADAEGQFEFKTKAMQLGIFAYSQDGAAAGVARTHDLNDPLKIYLIPTCDLHGQLLGRNDQPLANHHVRASADVSGPSNLNKNFSTRFRAKSFSTTTNDQGKYTLKNLPSELDMTLRADSLDGSGEEQRLDVFFLVPGLERPPLVSRLDRTSEPDERPLSEKFTSLLRDSKLGDYHLLVTICESTADNFVGRYLMDRVNMKEVMSFMNLQVRERDVEDEAARLFVESKGWPQPEQGKVFVCALDGSGTEIGRAVLELHSQDVHEQAAEFIRQYAPPQVDAIENWHTAIAEAERSGRKVWARVSQRYCGPCFRLSRWLDDNRELLERDYVLLKIDNVRDLHGMEVAYRIVSHRDHFGVPFHAIFSAQEELLIDSEGPAGNIGHPASFEGREHLRKMLTDTKTNLTDEEIEAIVATLE